MLVISSATVTLLLQDVYSLPWCVLVHACCSEALQLCFPIQFLAVGREFRVVWCLPISPSKISELFFLLWICYFSLFVVVGFVHFVACFCAMPFWTFQWARIFYRLSVAHERGRLTSKCCEINLGTCKLFEYRVPARYWNVKCNLEQVPRGMKLVELITLVAVASLFSIVCPE